jgi:hypothetical protein
VSGRLCREAALFPLGTGTLYRGFFLCRELSPLLSANRLCAESLGSGSRHRSELSVEAAFPVVVVGSCVLRSENEVEANFVEIMNRVTYT